MRKLPIFMTLLGLCSPVALAAEDSGVQKYPALEDIRFTPAVERAFDYSGNLVTHVTLPDGSVFARHNGTMQNVTVARVGPEGEIQTLCTSSRAEAAAFLAGLDIRSTDGKLDMPQEVK
jgi:hypothetical protein